MKCNCCIFYDKVEGYIVRESELISIVIPVYNVEKYLDECIQSVVTQTYKNLEIILIDDGSTDYSSKLCDLWGERDSRIRVFHKSNGGMSDARNYGLQHMKGNFFAFIDSDDYIASNMIELLYNCIQKNRADLAIASFQRVNENGSVINKSFGECIMEEKVVDGAEILEQSSSLNLTCFSVVWNRLYRTNTFRNLYFPVGKIQEDEFIFTDVYSYAKKVSVIPNILYFYRQRKGSIMNKKGNKYWVDGGEALLLRGDFFYKRNLFSQAFFWYRAALSTWVTVAPETKIQMGEALERIDRLVAGNYIFLNINMIVWLFLIRRSISPFYVVRVISQFALDVRSVIARYVYGKRSLKRWI